MIPRGLERPPLSGIVIARDEEERLAACLASLRPHCAELLVVLDARHSEGARRAAEAGGARVVVHEFQSHVLQKNVAVDAAAHDWLLSLDADEALDEGLERDLAAFPWHDPACAGRFRRRNWYLGGWVDGTGWRKDGATRLFHRGRARFAGSWVHDRVEGEGLRVVALKTLLLHWPYRDMAHHLEKVVRYTGQLAVEQHARGRRFSWWKLVLDPPWKVAGGWVGGASSSARWPPSMSSSSRPGSGSWSCPGTGTPPVAELRVLHVNDQAGWGGGEHQTYLLIRGLESLGVENHALVRRGGALAGRLAGLLPQGRLHLLPGAAWPLLPLLAWRWSLGMDVVHAHTGRATLAFPGCRGALRVAHRRIPDRPSPGGLRRLARAHLVLCVSDLIRTRLEGWGLGADGRPRLLTLHSAADLPGTRPAAIPLEGEPALGFLGHFRRHKGLDLLLAALPAVLDRHPGLVLHLAGEGAEQALLEQRVREGGLEARVVFHPLPQDAAAWLAGLDLFVMPSREEGLGSVALLAQALGVPVLATTAGGIPEGVAHGRTGWLVEAGSTAALEEGLALALGDVARLRAWGAAGPAWVEERFTPAALSRRTLDAYVETRR